jgi:serine/threonine-protein kinase
MSHREIRLPDAPLIGETLGRRYKLVRLLGQGGMGSVYEAERSDTADRFAVKVLHGHLLDPSLEWQRRFRREGRAASALGGDHIVRVIELGTDEDTSAPYMVTEYLEGEDLQQLLDRAGPLAVEGALRVALQALAGLKKAHEASVIHRDIKPANIFLARGPGGSITVKLLDFGIAKIKADPLSGVTDTGLTATGGFLGSPLYMSPEQVQNSRDVDHRTDLWSLGSALYCALAGRAPHQHATSVGQLLVAICTSPPPPLSEVAPWVPREVAKVVDLALERRPADRYPTAAAMFDAIRELVPSGPALAEEMLISSSGLRPAQKVVVTPAVARPIRGDAVTEVAAAALGEDAAALGETREAPGKNSADGGSPGSIVGSGVPALLGAGSKARSKERWITVDPRRFLGAQTETWTFSFDVHKNVSSFLARVWKSLRRGGADIPPLTYGKTWVLFEPRTGRTITDGDGTERLSLEAAGLRPGIVLWVLSPDAVPLAS